MIKKANFSIVLNEKIVKDFANLSGDKNKIHLSKKVAQKNKFKKPIAHGAYLIALMSRLAGTNIPGKNALVHSYEINFKKPILIPCKILVNGRLISKNKVEVKITDHETGSLYAQGYYIFSSKSNSLKLKKNKKIKKKLKITKKYKTFITGSSGSMANIIKKKIKNSVCFSAKNNYYNSSLKNQLNSKIGVNNIIHCGWPLPDNQNILSTANSEKLTEYYIKKPILDIIELAKILKKKGRVNSKLILVGSTFSKPGRHNFKYPFYSLGKSYLNTLTDILALELGKYDMSCVLLEFDVIDGGMNLSIDATSKIAASDRKPNGKLPTINDAVKQIRWVLSNSSDLINGSKINLSGGALP
jgi:hypothetical protein